ncbi:MULTISPECIES: N-acetylmuramoyl-L-alanine amidase-like domain-containing protein [Thermodesulfovibrio]|uniref:Inner membrane protein n=2 Tax=Thermodesulfovibrio yellowstonii TaxID=28262 RepID=B5YK76_THEYD|nr:MULTISPECIES: N-acetylmuramoyl-L-alanine amidase-like domain-containing protein [Thermodesulfovibrio]ACI21126.1 putative inner membrane protein [Thermodesulfovibrio yellowstonii DSM 11347]MDI6865318.1 DUF1460 domain-containing protein [Thermodesulfovibrio yellowstonii]GLI53810.1 hypothetical protein TISLANDTSLP1_15030 [Thermodesulfovibrio islandicus]
MIFKEGKIKIETILKELLPLEGEDRIIKISKIFMNIPYKKNTLKGSFKIEEELTIDFEEVDCMTFIEYVEALRLSNNFESFVENLKAVRYFDSIVDFQKRRHFFSDWDYIPTLKNITSEIGMSYCKTSLKKLNKINKHKRWIEGLPVSLKKINYIPRNNIKKIVDKLPSVCYCGFYSSKEGLDVEHVGILINKEKPLTLRHASSIKGEVVDEPFIEYVMNKEGIILYKPISDKWTEEKK